MSEETELKFNPETAAKLKEWGDLVERLTIDNHVLQRELEDFKRRCTELEVMNRDFKSAIAQLQFDALKQQDIR
jgi:predicted RNase H-like nuclease (RuvC/YqgF family)